MRRAQATAEVRDGDHVSVFYDEPEERWALLADYFREGFDKHQLCVFVTKDSPRHVRINLRAAGLDVAEHIRDSSLRIFTMEATYLPQGQFVSDYMLNNVAAFIEDAETLGYSGLRTAGEMDWLAHYPEYHEEAALYEHDVNHLGIQHANFTGLCLYAIAQAPVNVVTSSLLSHPVFIYEGALHHNPYYLAPENFVALANDTMMQSAPVDKAIQKLFACAAPA